MGSKGSQSTNTVQNTAQTYSANPAISGIGSQAISQAQAAGSQPFQMPTAPVAGFSQDQQTAFGNVNNAQGMAQPYFNQAANYFSPEGAQSFLNPYAANVMAGMNDVFGQQRSQLEGNLVQSAGGVGADRIGVGQANLAHQQDLAAGQTLAGLYSDSARQAQAAGQGMGNLGMMSQNAALQGAQAQLQTGGLQQQLAQQQLNAPYQNQLARLAYPYQNAQFLAGVTGGLAPAFGGTTTGNQTGQTTAPQPSMLSQILGVGTAGAGLYGAFGGSGSGKGGTQTGASYGGYGSGSNGWGSMGGVQYPAFAEGGEVGEEDNQRIPGITSNEGLSPIPYLPLHGGAGHSSPLTGGVTFQQPQQEKPQDSGGGLGDVLKAVSSIAPFFALKDGGVAGYYEGGADANYSPDEMGSSPLVERLARNLQNFGQAQRPSGNPYAPPLTQKPSDTTFADRFANVPAPNGPSAWDRFKGMVTPNAAAAPTTGEVNPSPVANGAVPFPRPNPLQPTAAQTADAYRMPSPTAKGTNDEEAPVHVNRETTPREVMRGMMPQANQPYPDALERNPGQVATRSPWMALVNAGATMAATPGPLGVSLGKGMLAGTKSLDDQRKELQTEQSVNQKAQALYQTAKAELDKYNKMTPYEAASVQARNKEIDQSNVPGGTKPVTERDISAVMQRMESDPRFVAKPFEEKRAIAIQAIQQFRASQGIGAAAAPVLGATSANPVPDPGDGRRQKGMWYIGPTGKPQQWQ